MANRELTITLRARNAIAAGIKSAERQLNALASGIGNAFRTASRWILGVGAAVGAVTAKALAGWSGQERATTALTSAFRAYGEEVDANVAQLSKLASAIQDETAVGDEVTIARMARLKMLGMETALLPAAAKGVIALAEAGMEEDAAMKALVAAQEGEFAMLGRYLPALRSATSESEKAAIVNEFLARGYQASKDRLNTVGGAWAALKGRVGDAWEELGKVLAQNAGLQSMLTAAGNKVKELSDRFAAWAASGGVVNLIAGIKLFAEETRHATTVGWAYFAGFFKGGLMEPAKQAWQYVSSVGAAWWRATRAMFELAGAYAEAMWQKIKNPLKKFQAPDTKEYKAALDEFWQAAVGAKVEASTAFQEMFAKIEADERRHAAAVTAISEKQRADLAAIGKARVADEKKVLEQLNVARENHAKRIAELQDQINKERAKLAEGKEGQAERGERNRRIEALEAEAERFGKEAEKQGAIGRMSVKEWIEDQAGQRAARQQEIRDAARRDRLEGVVKRGDRALTGEERAWLEASRAIEAAKLQAEIAEGERIKLQNEIKEQNDQDSANIAKTAASVGKMELELANLLRAKG